MYSIYRWEIYLIAGKTPTPLIGRPIVLALMGVNKCGGVDALLI